MGRKAKVFLKIELWPIFLAVVMTTVILFMPIFSPSKLPLFYSLPWGEGQLAMLPQFFILPAILVCITLINLMIYWQLHDKQRLFKQVIQATSLVCATVLLVSFMKIILIFI
ncbi:hypothetical protein HY386_01230 [Candidatus Daviesbacteria bacterium]|nr:hypothetical protein [Candidatus Daviesbacteria bacterium]